MGQARAGGAPVERPLSVRITYCRFCCGSVPRLHVQLVYEEKNYTLFLAPAAGLSLGGRKMRAIRSE